MPGRKARWSIAAIECSIAILASRHGGRKGKRSVLGTCPGLTAGACNGLEFRQAPPLEPLGIDTRQSRDSLAALERRSTEPRRGNDANLLDDPGYPDRKSTRLNSSHA